MLHAGLDLSRKRLDFRLLDADGVTVEAGSSPPDADGLPGLAERLGRYREQLRAAIESMNGGSRRRVIPNARRRASSSSRVSASAAACIRGSSSSRSSSSEAIACAFAAAATE